MGRLYLAGLLALVLAPFLLATMLVDLTWRKSLALAVLTLAIAGYFGFENSLTVAGLYWHWTMPASPAAEAQFVSAAADLQALREAHAEAGGDASALHRSEAALCALPSVATDWIGKVNYRYIDGTARSVSVAVTIWPSITVRTALFADASNTLIGAGEPVFAQAKTLNEGDVVRFSGRIIGHTGACPGDPPADRNEKMRDPDFLFKFSGIARAGKP